jgi:hypothetical protein
LNRLLILTLCLALSACTTPGSGGTDTTDATGQPLPVEQGKDFTDGYTNSTEQAVSSISLDDVISAVSVPNANTTNASKNPSKNLTINALSRKCRTIEAGSNDDGDDDGVPQEVTYYFNPENPNCTASIPGGKRTLAGRLKIKNQEKGGYRETLEVSITDKLADRTIVERRNGSAILFQGKQRLIKVFDLRVNRRINNKPEFSYRNTLTYTFVPNILEDRKVSASLPAGTISVTGKTEWFEGERRTRSFLVSSPTALNYDPACVAQQGQGITGGTETLNQNGTIVQINYGTCGVAPTVQFDPK